MINGVHELGSFIVYGVDYPMMIFVQPRRLNWFFHVGDYDPSSLSSNPGLRSSCQLQMCIISQRQ
jgi:hypothetical protein